MSNEVQDAPESATPIEAKKISKIDEKRQRIFQERLHRLVNSGKTPEEALAQIQKEDYERLSMDKKHEMLRRAVGFHVDKLGKDVGTLHDNQKQLADIMDVNFRAFEALLVALGVTQDQIKLAMLKAERDVIGEREAKREEAKKEVLAEHVDEAGKPEEPAEAQIFGG